MSWNSKRITISQRAALPAASGARTYSQTRSSATPINGNVGDSADTKWRAQVQTLALHGTEGVTAGAAGTTRSTDHTRPLTTQAAEESRCVDGGRAGGSCSDLARRPGVCVRSEDTQVEAGGALPEGRRAMPEGRLTKPEGLQARADTLSPAGADGDQRAAHGGRASCGKHQWTRPERQRRKPEGRKVCQQAATAVASSPEAVTRELERRLREARARLSWCGNRHGSGSCGDGGRGAAGVVGRRCCRRGHEA